MVAGVTDSVRGTFAARLFGRDWSSSGPVGFAFVLLECGSSAAVFWFGDPLRCCRERPGIQYIVHRLFMPDGLGFLVWVYWSALIRGWAGAGNCSDTFPGATKKPRHAAFRGVLFLL